MVSTHTIVHGQSALTVREGINDDMTNLANGLNQNASSQKIVAVAGTDTVDFTLIRGTYDCTVTVDSIAEAGRMDVINYTTSVRVEQAFITTSDGDRWFRTSALGDGTDWTAWTLSNIKLTGDTLKLDPQAVKPAFVKGKMWFDDEHKTFAYYTDVEGVVFHVGIDIPIRIVNRTGVEIPAGKAIRNGGIDIATGEIKAELAKADSLVTSFVIGFTVADVPIDGESFVNIQGHIHNIDTSLLVLGGTIFLSDIDAGEVVQSPPDIASALGTVQTVSDTVGEYFVKIDNLIAYPLSHGYLRGQNTPQYTLLTGIKQDVADFTEIEEIILTGDKLAGTLTGSLGGSYVIDFTAIATFPSLISTRTLFFEVYNITQDKIEGAFPKNIPRDAVTDGVSFTAPVRLETSDVYKIRVYSDTDIVISLTNCAFMLTSRHLGT